MPEVTLPNGFVPRPYQRRFMRYLDKGGKRAVWVVHRRGGKDLTALHQTCKAMHERRGAYWHVFPSLEQGRKAIWEGFTKSGERIMEQVFPAALRKAPKAFLPNAEMVVELKCGSLWRLMGSDQMEVVGAGPVGVVFSEFSLAKPKTWDLVRPMLRENEGWAAFVYTPRGNNHGKKLFDMAKADSAWFCELQTLLDTRAYDPDVTLAEERASGMPEELIRQEYLCDWTAANVGSVFGDLVEQLEQRGGVSDFVHERDGVMTSWDLGLSDSTACWLWRVRGHGAEVLDYFEASGKPLSYYFDELERRGAGLSFLKHWLPHDARARTLASGVSVLEQFRERFGNSAVAIGPNLSLLDGIQAGRWLLQQKDTRIHARCTEGLDVLRAYRYEWDEDKKAFGRKPVHDFASHGADAWRYLACVVRATELMLRPVPEEPRHFPRPPTTVGELFEAHMERAAREADA